MGGSTRYYRHKTAASRLIMKIGLYFGSFNPVHNGHLIIASHVLNFTDVQQVWLVLSPQNPLKPSATLLNEYNRLYLVNCAVEGETKIKASNIEFGLPKPSYTVDTMAYLAEKYPQHQFSIIMGSDSYGNLHKWKNYKVLLEHYPIYIYNRPGFAADIPAGTKSILLDAPLLDISSTRIREFIKTGKSIRFLVPDAVKDEIEKAGYYK
jgi:nicotinate-nucleotide adenylyltransferase